MFTKVLDILILFAVSTPMVGWISPKRMRLKILGLYTIFGLLSSIYFLLELYGNVSVNGVLVIGDPPLEACLSIDMLSVFMAFVILTLGLCAIIYSFEYMKKDLDLTIYYTLFLVLLAGLIGVVFAGDFFTLYVFWEIMSLTSYTLVAFRKESWEPLEAGFKYLIMSATGAANVLLAISFVYATEGTLNFAYLTGRFNNAQASLFLLLILFLLIVGFGINAAIVPFHTWLPDAHPAAPAPISAMLSGVVIMVSIYALCRVLFLIFPFTIAYWRVLLAVLSLITMTLGNITALLQRDVKRMLAYSSIGHVGYVLAGLSVGTQLGLTGALLHIFNHALMKGDAFLCAGAIIHRIGTRKLDEMEGIGRKMPATAAAFGISLFALAGMPPLNGFVSELTIFTSTLQANLAWLGIAIVLNSVLSAGYYLRIVRAMLQSSRSEKIEKARGAPIIMLFPIGIIAILIVLFGIWPDPVLELARKAAEGLLSIR